MDALRDIRYGFRSLQKSPGLASVAVLALTIGIGLTTTMFSIVYGALMKGLPFDEAERIVIVQRNNLSRDFTRMPVPIHDLEDYRAQQRSFEGLAGYYSGTVNVSGSERAERYDGGFVSANTFRILRERPLLGRDFRDGEDTPNAEKVAIIGYDMWQSRYDGDPQILGTSIRANGVPYTVIGVMPDDFSFPDNTQIWLPLPINPLTTERGEGQQLNVIGRLRPGVSIDRANADINAIASRLAMEYKQYNDGVSASVKPFIEGALGPEPRRLLYTMLGAVFFVLLIACANVANLLLDRAAHRTKEVGIRTALGASRGAVIRQFLAEALVLAAIGAVLGTLLAQGGITAFNRAIADTEPPFWIDIGLHPPVLMFVVAVALVATLASGAIPAIQSSRADINEILKDESRGASSFRIGRMSKGLVVAEIALSCGLLVAAALMIKSVTNLRNIEYGFDTENIFTARVGFPANYSDTLKQAQFWEQLTARLAALPGARAATLSDALPGVGGGDSPFALEGASYATDRDYPETNIRTVAPSFFETFGIPVSQGRGFASQDRQGNLPVAVVNQHFVREFFNGESPIGRRLRMGDSRSEEPWMTIVGVVPNQFTGDTEEPRGPMVYQPLAQHYRPFLSIAVAATGSPMSLTSAVRAAVASLDADIPIYWVYSMKEALARPTWFIRVFGTMFMIFGFMALFLAAVGLYAVMSFSVSRRTRELGIRMALGAQGRDVVRMIFKQGLLQITVGMVLGLALAAGVSRLLSEILFDVQPRDPVIFGSVALVLTLTGILACLLPAKRATRVDPLLALRME
ncbi:MAG TPA: ABC transporter permease [Gemmatimonadaceae bacterium]|nr:ABC transporter permease [Gemmatimonadaceae bacterium]